MKKLLSILLACALLMGCAGALADGDQAQTPTAEELLAGNAMSNVMSFGDYVSETMEYLNADGDVCDRMELMYARGDSGYRMLITYPMDSGASIGTMLIGGRSYVNTVNGETTYTLYATSEYAAASEDIAAGEGNYLVYPVAGAALELAVDDAGNYVVTAGAPVESCDQDMVAANGHVTEAGETVFDEYVYDAKTRRLIGETAYHMVNGERVEYMRATVDYAADGAAFAQAQPAGAHRVELVLNPGAADEAVLGFDIGAGAVSFVLDDGMALYSDEACTARVDTDGDGASYTADRYYVSAG